MSHPIVQVIQFQNSIQIIRIHNFMSTQASIELKDLLITTQIGTYVKGDVIPDQHLLDLTLWIDSELVLIEEDHMKHVFDYDPLIKEIDRLARDGHYETQERLMTRIVRACATYAPIKSLEIGLRKSPVMNQSGSLGVRLIVDAHTLNQMR
jgi:dihydroneopterin aldolase